MLNTKINGMRIFVMMLLCASLAPAEMEMWLSRQGSTLQAEFLEVRDDQVVLRTGAGREISVNLSDLAETSRARVEQLLREKEKRIEGLMTSVGVFRELQFPNYDAVLRTPNGQVLLYPKSNGQRLGDIIEINLQGRYTRDGSRQSRIPVKLTEAPKWEEDHITYHLLMTDDVKAELYYRFKPDRIEMGFRIDEPASVISTEDYRIQMSIPPLLQYNLETKTYSGPRFPDPIPFQRVEQTLQNYKILIAPRKGKKETYKFAENIDHFPGASESIRIMGAYGNLNLTLEAPETGYIWARIYQGKAPFGGYSIAFRKEDNQSLAEDPKQILTLEISP